MRHYISLGAGVQSSTLALMAAHGEITPMPEGAIFADTQAEPAGVYRWLDWLEGKLPFPIHRVTAGDLEASALKLHVSKKGGRYFRTAIPFFTTSSSGKKGMIDQRTCTRDFKIIPITQALRRLGEVKRGTKVPAVTSWIGISLDEFKRVKSSREPWITNRHPLIEGRITRRMCLDWMREEGYPEPPRSACVFCPFRGREDWRRLRNEDPEGWARAVAFDREARERRKSSGDMGSTVFIHPSLKPLSEVDTRNDVDRGQGMLWEDECDGVCGV